MLPYLGDELNESERSRIRYKVTLDRWQPDGENRMVGGGIDWRITQPGNRTLQLRDEQQCVTRRELIDSSPCTRTRT